jgi:hypothetical protein
MADPSKWNDWSDPREPIAAMFDRAEASGSNKDCKVTKLSFDDTWEFVSEYFAECGEEGSGEVVTCFVPNSQDIDACKTQK